jgi:cytidylate kinase
MIKEPTTLPNEKGKKRLMIAIDGPVAAGKTSVGYDLAKDLNFLFFDTGVMYRAVSLAVLQKGIDFNDEAAVGKLAHEVKIDVLPASKDDLRMYDVHLDGQDVTWQIRQPQVEEVVSPISTYPEVRHEMTHQQREIGQRGNVVMVGRDIGTVVLPDADLKFFLEASVEERARRRYEEIRQRKEQADLQKILTGLKVRDRIDSTRKVAPLVPAKEAIVIATDGKKREQVVKEILGYIHRYMEIHSD